MSNARSRRWIVLVVVGLVLPLACVLGGWALRDAIATSMARDALTRRGVTCDERFGVEVAPFFGSATVGPTRCTREGGHIEAIELLGPARVQLSGMEAASVEVESLRVVLRDRDLPGGSSWAPELARLQLEQRVAGLVKGLAELSRLGLPPTTVLRGEVHRGGASMATAERLVLTPGADDVAQLALQRVVFEAMMGTARLTLSDVTGTATGSVVHLEGQASARAGIALLGTFSTAGRFSLDATALESADPQLRLRASF